MPAFQRARTDEQRAVRHAEILSAARAMLAEQPLADISLNALSRRVGLATSNVLRYFESREAILLELIHAETTAWLDDLDPLLVRAARPSMSLERRMAAVAAALARSLERHPHFCELISAQASVLERNVSTEVAARFKRASLTNLERLSGQLVRALPELGASHDPVVSRLAARATLVAGALWVQARPSSSMADALASDAQLRPLRVSFRQAAEDTMLTLIVGTLARSGRWRE